MSLTIVLLRQIIVSNLYVFHLEVTLAHSWYKLTPVCFMLRLMAH